MRVPSPPKFVPTIKSSYLFVNVAKQNNVFEIDENGTKAASTSMIEVATGVSNGKLVFDRPFMYMIIDNATELPVYIGTVSNVK